jgi:hypothetical protein
MDCFKEDSAPILNKRDFDLSVDFYELRPDGRYLPLASICVGRASSLTRRGEAATRAQPSDDLEFQSQTLTARLLSPCSRIVAASAARRGRIFRSTIEPARTSVMNRSLMRWRLSDRRSCNDHVTISFSCGVLEVLQHHLRPLSLVKPRRTDTFTAVTRVQIPSGTPKNQ